MVLSLRNSQSVCIWWDYNDIICYRIRMDQYKNAAILLFCIFKWISLNENILILLRISLKFVPDIRIDNNGLDPTRRQAIIWTNGGLVYCRTFASLGLTALSYTANDMGYTGIMSQGNCISAKWFKWKSHILSHAYSDIYNRNSLE